MSSQQALYAIQSIFENSTYYSYYLIGLFTIGLTQSANPLLWFPPLHFRLQQIVYGHIVLESYTLLTYSY